VASAEKGGRGGGRPTAERLTGLYWGAELDAHHLVFLCANAGGAQPTPSSDEISECGYWPPDTLPRPISDFTVRRIHDALVGEAPVLPVVVPPRTWLE